MIQGRWSAENFARLETLLAGPPGLAVFDFDNTLIYNDLGEACMYFLARRGLLPTEDPAFQANLTDPRYHSPEDAAPIVAFGNRYHAEYAAADRDEFAARILSLYEPIHEQADLSTTYRWTRVFFMGRTPDELGEVARQVFEYELSRAVGFEDLEREAGAPLKLPTGIRVVPESAALIDALRQRNWEVRIVTASPRWVIAPVVERWGLRPEQVTGMELATGADGKILPEILEPMPCQAGKVTALRAVPGLEDRPLRLAVGDSVGDWELLCEAEQAVLFDRGNEDLRARAAERGFIIQNQFAPVDE